MDPQGIRGVGLEVHGGHTHEVLYRKLPPFKGFGVRNWSILMGLGIREDHLIILGVNRTKKVKNHCPKG